MIIKRLHLDNFGKFKGYTLELGPEFNVIHGQNEDGKSTIMAFILMMFYGHGGRTRDLSTNPRKKYRPWNGEEMRGRILFEHEGTSYRLERSFSTSNTTDDVALWNEDLGVQRKLSSKVTPGEEFFGIGEEAFLRSVFIGQGGSLLNTAAKNDEITEKLLNLVTTGSEEVSYERVFSQLQSNEELLVSRNKKNGMLIRTRDRLEALEGHKRTAMEDEEQKKAYAREVADRLELQQDLLEEKEALDKKYAGYSLYSQMKEYEEAIGREERRIGLSDELKAIDGKLTTPSGILDENFYSEGTMKIRDYGEILSELKHQKVEVLESQKIAAELEGLMPTAITDETFRSLSERENQRKDIEASLDRMKEELRKDNDLHQRLEEKKSRQAEYDETSSSYSVVEASYKSFKKAYDESSAAFELKKKEVEELRSQRNGLDKTIQSEESALRFKRDALESFGKELKEKIEDARLQLENAKKPQVYVEELPGGRELNKTRFIIALLSLMLFIGLGIFVEPALFGGIIVSLLLFVFSYSKSEKRVVTRNSINENLIHDSEARLEKIEKEGGSRLAADAEGLKNLEEKVDSLNAELLELMNTLEVNEGKLQEMEKDTLKKKEVADGKMLEAARLQTKMEEASRTLERAKAGLIMVEDIPTQEVLKAKAELITGLEIEKESMVQELSGTLSAYGSPTIEAFSKMYYDYQHHLEDVADRKKEFQDNLVKLTEIETRQRDKLEEIKAHLLPYRSVETILEAESALDEVRTLLDDKEKVMLQLNALEVHRKELEKTKSLEDLREFYMSHKEKIDGLVAEQGSDFTDLEGKQKLKADLDRINEGIAGAREGIIALESEVREKYRNRRNISQIENEIEEERMRLKKQELDYEALRYAREVLEGAFATMQSSFGPKVNKATQEVFARLTGGKYNEVMVSRDLSITVQDGVSQRMYEWAFLSGGTIDQAYLSLRLAISDLIVQDSRKKPLFLDDVLMQYDDSRAKEGLRFLQEYSSLRDVPIQSVLFTCHRRIVEWAEELAGINVLELYSS